MALFHHQMTQLVDPREGGREGERERSLLQSRSLSFPMHLPEMLMCILPYALVESAERDEGVHIECRSTSEDLSS